MKPPKQPEKQEEEMATPPPNLEEAYAKVAEFADEIVRFAEYIKGVAAATVAEAHRPTAS